MNSKIYEKVRPYLCWFFIYAFVGWIYEVIIYLVNGHGFVNRGFLYGPYLPVYGIGALLILIMFSKLAKKKITKFKINIMPLIIFLLITIVTTILEFFTSYFLEIVFDISLWNYSNWSINFDGRVALIPSLRFGLLGILCIYLIQPILESIYDKFTSKTKNVIFFTLLSILIIDLIITLVTKFM